MTDQQLDDLREKFNGVIVQITGDHPFAGEICDFVDFWEEEGKLRMQVVSKSGKFLLWNTQTKRLN